MKRSWTWLGVVAGVLALSPAAAESQGRLRFDHLTVEDGLSHNHVYAILKDSRGFIWFGTADGANRYDGNGFVVYRHDPDDPGSLPSATVEAFFEDSRKRLWVGTSSGDAGLSRQGRRQDAGLSLYDRRARSLQDLRPGRRLDLAGANAVRDFVEDRDGSLWLATGDGLARFDPEKRTFKRYPLTRAARRRARTRR